MLAHSAVSMSAGRLRNHHPYTPLAAGTADGRESTSSRENTRAGFRNLETSADRTAAAYSGHPSRQTPQAWTPGSI